MRQFDVFVVGRKHVNKNGKDFYILNLAFGECEDGVGYNNMMSAFVSEDIYEQMTTWSAYTISGYIFYKDSKVVVKSVDVSL